MVDILAVIGIYAVCYVVARVISKIAEKRKISRIESEMDGVNNGK